MTLVVSIAFISQILKPTGTQKRFQYGMNMNDLRKNLILMELQISQEKLQVSLKVGSKRRYIMHKSYHKQVRSLKMFFMIFVIVGTRVSSVLDRLADVRLSKDEANRTRLQIGIAMAKKLLR